MLEPENKDAVERVPPIFDLGKLLERSKTDQELSVMLRTLLAGMGVIYDG